MEGRGDHVDVGQVAATEVRVVVDEDVAGRELAAAWMTAFTARGIEPRWMGRSGPCATISPRTSKMPQE